MADNVTTPIPSGKVLAADDVGGVLFPRSKLSFGPKGVAVAVDADNPLPVSVSGGIELGETSLAALESISTTGPLTDMQLRAAPVAVTAAGSATAAKQDAIAAALGDNLTVTAFRDRVPSTGPKAASGSLPIVMSNDQDPVYDHANGVKASVGTTSAVAITPPPGARYLRVHATADVFLRTDGAGAADDGRSILIKAGAPETIPVVGGVGVSAMVVSGTATLYATPSKAR